MTRQELINTVRTKIDELSPLDRDIRAMNLTNDKPIDSFADDLLDECCREVLLKAPAYRLGGQDIFISPTVNKDGCGYVVLPKDVIRVLEFKMAEWERTVTEIVDEGSSLAQRQSNPYLRGGVCKPVCVLGHRGGFRVIEYYSVKKSHKLERLICLKSVAAEDLPVDLQDILTWWCASRILQIVGKVNESQMAYERGKSLL